MKRVCLIHWSEEERAQRAALLQKSGCRVESDTPEGRDFFRRICESPPDAVVIDMNRLPSQGRDIALVLRRRKASRHIPLLFVGGRPEKVQVVRTLLPDAGFGSWETIREDLDRAIREQPLEPVVPSSELAGYSGKPLPAKLGIKTDSVISLLQAPEGFLETLGTLPKGARLVEEVQEETKLVLWFIRTKTEFRREIPAMAGHASSCPLWIIWPKKGSRIVTDLTQQGIREAALKEGLVDYKVCAVDETWSGLLFKKRES